MIIFFFHIFIIFFLSINIQNRIIPCRTNFLNRDKRSGHVLLEIKFGSNSGHNCCKLQPEPDPQLFDVKTKPAQPEPESRVRVGLKHGTQPDAGL
jgi:hypothetical protein